MRRRALCAPAARSVHRAPRVLATGALVPLLLTLVTACSGSDGGDDVPQGSSQGSSEPTEPTEPTGPSPSDEATPSPEPTEKPLSRFEDEPPVAVARDWARAYAQAVNAGQRDLRDLAPYSTEAGMQRFPQYGAEDLGLRYPGPMPFTPLDVEVGGDRAEVQTCMWLEGFAQDPDTGQPAAPRLVEPTTFVMVRSGGEWKVDDTLVAQGSCAQVAVKGLGF